MEWSWLTISLLSSLISLVLPGPIVQLPLQLSFQLVALLRWGIQYIEGDFACIWFRFFSERLKAWPPCCPPPSPSLSCPFPRGPPHSPELAWVERSQSGASREQTRVSLTASLLHSHSTESTDSSSAPPNLACLHLSGAHRHTVDLVHAHTNMHIFPSLSYQLELHVLSFSPHSFQSVHSARDPGKKQTTIELWKAIAVLWKAGNWDLVTKSDTQVYMENGTSAIPGTKVYSKALA